MSLIVQKFGGTSVANPERIKAVADKVAKYKSQGHDIIVVVSAMSGETNKLVSLTEEMMTQPDPREYDMVVSSGEQVTSGLTALALIIGGCCCPFLERRGGILDPESWIGSSKWDLF